MRRTRFDRWPCPIARTTDLVGDWWTPLVMREAFLGRRRFEDFQRSLGVPRAVLTKRLDRLVAEGLLVKVAYEEHPPRYEYRLTEKGRAFWDVLRGLAVGRQGRAHRALRSRNRERSASDRHR
jgi:DNA-binding HxlR family transcriptional regulator